MNLTYLHLIYNSQFNNTQNYRYFNTEEERDNFYNNYRKGNLAQSIKLKGEYNLLASRGQIRVEGIARLYQNYNYGWIYSNNNETGNKRLYFHIVQVEYLNHNVTILHILPDLLTTYCMGDWFLKYNNTKLIRAHTTSKDFDEVHQSSNPEIPILSKRLKYRKEFLFSDTRVLITSSVDLTSDFGTVEKPVIKSSSGQTYDRVTSNLNLYITTLEGFNQLNNHLKDYPWVARNIVGVTQLPAKFIDNSDLDKIQIKDKHNIEIYRLKNNHVSRNIELDSVSITKEEIIKYLGLQPNHKRILQDSMVDLVLTDMRGNELKIDLSKCNDKIIFKAEIVLGYVNEIVIYIRGYNNRDVFSEYIRYSMKISDFNELPTIINQSKADIADKAYTRARQDEQTFSGRLNMIENGNPQDKLFNAFGAVSSVFQGGLSSLPSNALNLYTDEYNLKRNRMAEDNASKLKPNTQSPVNFSHSHAIKNKYYGLHLLLYTPPVQHIQNIARYYSRYGIQINSDYGQPVQYIDMSSFPICQFIQMEVHIPPLNMPAQYAVILQELFKGGVTAWKVDPNTQDPFYNFEVQT